jgi:hypothetical protein
VLDEGTLKSFLISLLAAQDLILGETPPVGGEEVMTKLGITCCSTEVLRIS